MNQNNKLTNEEYETLKEESLDITWIEGALYAYNKYDQDAIITYQKKGR